MDVVKYLVVSGCYGISDNQSLASTESSASTEPWFCDACKAGVVPVSMSLAWLSAVWLLSLPVCLLALLGQSVSCVALCGLAPVTTFPSVCLSSSSAWSVCFLLGSVQSGSGHCLPVCLSVCLLALFGQSVPCLALGSLVPVTACLPVCLPALLGQSVSCMALCSLVPVTTCLSVCLLALLGQSVSCLALCSMAPVAACLSSFQLCSVSLSSSCSHCIPALLIQSVAWSDFQLFITSL